MVKHDSRWVRSVAVGLTGLALLAVACGDVKAGNTATPKHPPSVQAAKEGSAEGAELQAPPAVQYPPPAPYTPSQAEQAAPAQPSNPSAGQDKTRRRPEVTQSDAVPPSDSTSNYAIWGVGLASLVAVIGLIAGGLLLFSRIKQLEAQHSSDQFVDRGELQDLKRELEASQRRSADAAHERVAAEMERLRRERDDAQRDAQATRSRALALAAELPPVANRPPAGVRRPAPPPPSMPGLPSFISNESPEFKSAPVQALSHQVLVDAIMQAIRDVAVSGISITAANAAGRILSATRNETARQQLSQGQFGVDFYDAGGQASVQAPELMAFRLDGTEFRYVVPFPQAGRSSRFVIWFGPAEYKTNPVLAQQPAIGVVHGDGVLVKQRAGLLVSA